MDRNRFKPTNDYLFKYIFGKEEHKEITLDFINAVLELKSGNELKDIQFIDREFSPVTAGNKLSRLDILGITEKNMRINIEMQVASYKYMFKRTLYYWSRIYSDTIASGEEYGKLPRTVTINVLDYSFLPQQEFHSMYGIYNMATADRLTDDLEIHFLEIPKVDLKMMPVSKIEKWIAFLGENNIERLERIAMSEPAIKKAMQLEDVFTKNEIERRKYELREKAIRDYDSAMKASREEGYAEVFQRMVNNGISIADIAKMVNMTEEEVQRYL